MSESEHEAGDGATPRPATRPLGTGGRSHRFQHVFTDPTASSAPPRGRDGSRPGARRLRLVQRVLRDHRALTPTVGRGFLLLTLLARLPSIILPLSVLTYVTVASGSPLTAALCAAALHVGQAVSVALIGAGARWHRYTLTLMLLMVVQVAAVWLLVVSLAGQAQTDPGGAWPWHLALLTGLTTPQLAIATRMRWERVLNLADRDDLFDAAQQHEAVMDAMALVVGGALTGVIAVVAGPLWGILMGSALTVVAIAVMLLHRTAVPPVPSLVLCSPRPEAGNRALRRQRRAVRWLRFLPVLGGGWIGVMLGSIQACLVLFAATTDLVEGIGAQFAGLGLLSAISSVVAASFVMRRPWRLWIVASAASVLATLMMSIPTGTPAMILVLAVVGGALGPTLIAVFAILPQIAPQHGAVAMSATTHVLIQLGMAAGLLAAAGVGRADTYQSAAVVPVLASSLLLITAIAAQVRLQRVDLRAAA